MHVQVWFIVCSVWLLQLNICLAAEQASKINDGTSIPTNITTFQIKTTNAADLPKVQLQETAMIAESNKDKSNVSVASASASNCSNSSCEEILRRKITPTGNFEQPVKKEQLQGGNAIKEVGNTENVNNSSKSTKNATTSTTAKQPVVEGEKMVAENVYVNVINGSVTTKENKTLTKSPNENEQANVNGTINVPLNTEAGKSRSESKNITDITQISTVKVTTTAPVAPSLNTTVINVKTNLNNSTTSSTSTSTTTTSTTTTTTPKPKKPTVTYGVEDFPKLEDNIPELQEHTQNQQLGLGNDQNSSKFSTPETEYVREPPNAEPSQEFNSKLNRDNIVPIITVICTVPLAIGVIFIFYRRVKDFWSTRHYRRMDFLVDGMYND